jgi:hypothetical protein
LLSEYAGFVAGIETHLAIACDSARSDYKAIVRTNTLSFSGVAPHLKNRAVSCGTL